VAAGLVALAVPASASAAVTIGPDPLQERTDVLGGTRIFTNAVVPGAELASPIDGVVVRWRIRRGSGPDAMAPDTVTLRILRPTGNVNVFTAMGTSEPHMVPGGTTDPVDVYEYPTRLPIAAGDRIGLDSTANQVTVRAETSASYLEGFTAVADGQTASFFPGTFSNRYVLVNADVEPDCDGDSFGDETQDGDTSSCIPPEPAKAARTLTLDASKNKVKERKKVTLFGGLRLVTRQQGVCEAGQTVQLQRKRPSQATFTTFAQAQTDATGVFSAKVKVTKTFEYRALVPETATCAGQTSNTEKVKAKKPK
jgi:hypothetical protein